MKDNILNIGAAVILMFLIVGGCLFWVVDCSNCYTKKCPEGSRPNYSEDTGCICVVRPQ